MYTVIRDMFTGKDGKWSLRAFIAFFAFIAFATAGLLDATTEGVTVDESFYWACVTLILGLLAIRALQYVAEIRTGQKNTSSENPTNTEGA